MNGIRSGRFATPTGNPILMLCSDSARYVKGLESGADDYVTKPFSFAYCSPASTRWTRCRAATTRCGLHLAWKSPSVASSANSGNPLTPRSFAFEFLMRHEERCRRAPCPSPMPYGGRRKTSKRYPKRRLRYRLVNDRGKSRQKRPGFSSMFSDGPIRHRE